MQLSYTRNLLSTLSAQCDVGALGGCALMVSAPIKGAYDGSKESGVLGGLKGFGMGLGAGVLGGAAMAVGGVGTGIFLCSMHIFSFFQMCICVMRIICAYMHIITNTVVRHFFFW